MTDETPVLRTDRLLLRRIKPDDRIPFEGVLSDPGTMVHYPAPFDRPAVERWIQRALASYAEHGCGLYAVLLLETGEFLGDCGFLFQEVEGVPELELAYHLGRRYWNQGYATEAARACRDYAFETLGRQRLISLILPVNLASRRVAEKVGMSVEREVEFHGYHHLVYSLARAERGRD